MLNSLKQFIDEIRPKTVCSGVITAVIGPSLGSVSITGGPVIQNVHIPPTAAQGDRVTLYRDQGGVWHIVGTESKPSVPVSAQTANDIVGLITYKPTLTVTVTSGVTNLVWSTWPDFVGAFELQSSNISDAEHSDATTLAIVNGSTLSLLNLTADRWFRVRAVTRLFVRSAWSDWTAASPLAPIPAPTDTDQILYSADGMVWSLATWADLTSNFGSGGSSNFDELRIGDDPYTYIGSSARNIWGVESRYGNDYTILGVRHLADDRSDTVLLVGDNAESDLFWLVFYDHEGTEYSMLEVGADHARFLVDTTIEGQLAVQDGLSLTGALSLTGDISMSNGALVDGIDLSAHAASDSAHHAPVTLTAAADSLLSLSTQAIDLDTQAANLVLAGPTGGAAATPTMRGLVFADIPSSSNPGAAAAVLATNTSGQIQLTGLGIGVAPLYNTGIRSQPTFNYVNVWLYGIANVLQHTPVSDGDTLLIGYENKVIVTGTANNSGALYSARQSIGWQSSGAITSVVGEYIRVDENYGYIGTICGVMIHDIAQGSYGAAWSLYSTDANAPSYFAGNLLIGTTDSTGLGSSGGLKIASNFIHTGTVFESGDTTPKFGSYTLTIPATGTVALGADTLTATTTNNSGIANHTHALTCTDDGDTNPSTLLKSGPSGQLRLRKIGIGTASGSNTGDITQAAGGDVFTNADGRGLATRFINPTGLTAWTAHFRPGETTGPGEGSLAAFAWQGAPFTTPVFVSYAHNNDYLRWYHSGAARFLLSRPITNSAAAWQNKTIVGRMAATRNGAIGLRVDDGTDNNYAEIYLDATAEDGGQRLRFSYRSGGGAVVTNTAAPVLWQGSFVALRLSCLYSAGTYAIFGYSVNEAGGSNNILGFNATVSWCPAAGRVGLVGSTVNASNSQACDWLYTDFG